MGSMSELGHLPCDYPALDRSAQENKGLDSMLPKVIAEFGTKVRPG